MFKIVSKIELAQGTIIANKIIAPKIAAKAKPGQFIILRTNETGERIPLTIADTNHTQGTITIIYAVVGKTTSLLKNLNVSDYIKDIAGPLGQPTPIQNKGTIICVGGGTGVAVLYPITRGFKKAGNKVIGIIGSRTKNLLILENKMLEVSDELYICTDDGSYGHHGFVTDILKEQLTKLGNKVKESICIGPVPMMQSCSKITANFNIPTLASLNAIMVDGTGMCGCCRVTVEGKTKFACVDGPEFDAHKVDFDNLSLRLTAYHTQEQEAMNNYQECIIKLNKK